MANNQNIDTLNVEITANSSSATNALANLKKQLADIPNLLSGINTNAIKQMADQLKITTATMNALRNSMSQMKREKLSLDTTDLANSVKFIRGSLDSVRRSMASMGSLATAAIGGDNSAFISLARQYTKIKGILDSVRSEFDKLGNTSVENPAIAELGRQIEDVKAKLDEYKQEASGFTDGMKQSNPYWDELKQKIVDAENELRSLQQAQNDVMQNEPTVDPFAPFKQSCDELQDRLDTMKQSVEDATGRELKVDTSNSGRDVDNLKNKISAIATVVNRVFGSIKAQFSQFTGIIKGIPGMFKKLTGFMDKGFMKILRYAFGIRSLYVLFRRLKQAVKDSFADLQYSGAFFETTRANVESLKTSLATLKFQMGAAFEPIFNYVAPALQTLINYLIAAANAISAFMAKITGHSTYSKVEAVTLAAKDNTGGAAKNAKELNKQLQKFDELNNLTTPNNGGGGGGGGGSATGDHATYTEAAVDSVLGDFGKKLAEAIRAGKWNEAGKVITEKFTEVMNSIPWNKIFKAARDFGTNLADFLNGLISPDTFVAMGKTIANGLNTIIYAFQSFGERFNFKNAGSSIGGGLNSFFTNFDWAALGRTINTWINGILDLIIEFLETAKWVRIGSKFAEMLNEIDWFGILGKVGTAAKLAIKGLFKGIAGYIANANLGTNIVTALVGYFATLPARITAAIGTFAILLKTGAISAGDLLAVGGNILGGIVGGIEAAIAGWKWGNIIGMIVEELGNVAKWWSEKAGTEYFNIASTFRFTDYLEDMIASLKDGTFLKAVSRLVVDLNRKVIYILSGIWVGINLYDIGRDLIRGILNGIGLSKEVSDKIMGFFDTVVAAIKKIFGIASPAKKMVIYGKYILLGILEGFVGAFKEIPNKISAFFDKIKSALFPLGDNSTSWDFKANFETTMDGVVENVPGLTTLRRAFTWARDSWTGTTASLEIDLAGDVDTIEDIHNVRAQYKETKKEWTSKDATLSASVGGQLKKPSDITSWKDSMTDLRVAWASKSATMSASVGGQLNSPNDINTWSANISSLSSTWAKSSASAKFESTFSQPLDAVKSYANAIKDLVANWQSKHADFTMNASISASTPSVTKIANQIIDNLNVAISKNPVLANSPRIEHIKAATGGVVKGATSLIAGEDNKAEAIVPLERNLGWLSIMSDMMVDGLQKSASLRYSASPSSLSMVSGTYGASSGNSNMLLQQQNELLARQNELLQIIANKDVSINSRDVFNAVRTENQSYVNRTGISPLMA